jgi:aminopeptidase N
VVQGWVRRAVAVVAVALLAGCTPDKTAAPPRSSAPTRPPDFRPGSVGIGDPYLPTYGNGGYDVASYDLKLRYAPKTGDLSGTATIAATAIQDLSRFNLDFAHLSVSAVTVDGQPAQTDHNGNELVVTPKSGIVRGRPFTVVIRYGGKPQPLPNKSLGEGGWLRTEDGGFALGEPDSASSWYPVNDHPADKATFSLAMTVPNGVEVVSNGVPGPRDTAKGWTTWRWSESAPMASYLSTVAIGQYRIRTSTHAGKPMVIAIPQSLPPDGPAAQSMNRTGEIADFLATQFGPYPFDAYGGIVLDDARVRYALETQSRPVYGNVFFRSGPVPDVVAHELAHQWFGDSVALERWQDIWLNEGFATYAEWLWTEHRGFGTTQQTFLADFRGIPRTSSFWSVVIGDPGIKHMFDGAVYQRGAMTLQALRNEIGTDAFFEVLHRWTQDHAFATGTTEAFTALAEQVSGQRLDDLFQTWLFEPHKPPPGSASA